MKNEYNHDERLKRLEEFENEFPSDLEKLNNRVKELMEIEQADELNTQFEKFKEECNLLMKKKKDLIKEFQDELNSRDTLYISNMKKFHADIKHMIDLMNKQFRVTRKIMLEHLDKIEEKYLEERKNILGQQYQNNMKQLLEDLNNLGSSKSEALSKLQDDNERFAKNSADKSENSYINKVIDMEAHFNKIKEKVAEFYYEIKILFEKLGYRLKIREEKIKEAESKKKQFQDWSRKLNDQINNLNRLYKKNDVQRRLKNSQLKTELIKMTESYETLKDKFKHFEKHDELKFQEIYDMKSKETKELALKVVLADRTIKSQQLGMENLSTEKTEGFTFEELQKEQVNENQIPKKKKTPEEEQKEFERNIIEKISIPRVRQVFDYIITEGEFLIDRKTEEECENKSDEEKFPAYLKSICNALNIKNEVELNQLLNLFYEHARKTEKQENNKEDIEEKENNEGNENNPDILNIDPNEVLDILISFHEDKKKRAHEKMKNNAVSGQMTSENSEEAKRERMKYLSETYWEKLGKTISDKTFNVWKALDISLSSYHKLLFERKKLVENVQNLNEQHKELEGLLDHYQNCDTNKKLIFKPGS